MSKYIVILLLLLLGCNEKKTVNTTHSAEPLIKTSSTLDKTEQMDKKENDDVISLISSYIDYCGFIDLPFSYDYNAGVSSKAKCDFSDKEDFYNKLRQKLGCDVVFGVLPDTSDYVGVLVGLVASMMNVELLTINSEGKLIERKSLMHNNCIHYVEEDIFCYEQVTISDSLLISYRYESKYIIYDPNDKPHTKCDIIIQSGRIGNDGKIILSEFEESTCE